MDIVKKLGPITGEKIAELLDTTRASIRSDLDFLSQAGLLAARPRVGYIYKGTENLEYLHKKLGKITVEEYHSMAIVVKENASVYDCIVQLFLDDVGSLFIVDENKNLQGVVSRKDLLKTTIGNSDIKSLPVSVIMTRMPKIVITYMDESLVSVAKKIVETEVDSLPIVNEKVVDGKTNFEVVGRITKTNITRAFLDFAQDK